MHDTIDTNHALQPYPVYYSTLPGATQEQADLARQSTSRPGLVPTSMQQQQHRHAVPAPMLASQHYHVAPHHQAPMPHQPPHASHPHQPHLYYHHAPSHPPSHPSHLEEAVGSASRYPMKTWNHDMHAPVPLFSTSSEPHAAQRHSHPDYIPPLVYSAAPASPTLPPIAALEGTATSVAPQGRGVLHASMVAPSSERPSPLPGHGLPSSMEYHHTSPTAPPPPFASVSHAESLYSPSDEGARSGALPPSGLSSRRSAPHPHATESSPPRAYPPYEASAPGVHRHTPSSASSNSTPNTALVSKTVPPPIYTGKGTSNPAIARAPGHPLMVASGRLSSPAAPLGGPDPTAYDVGSPPYLDDMGYPLSNASRRMSNSDLTSASVDAAGLFCGSLSPSNSDSINMNDGSSSGDVLGPLGARPAGTPGYMNRADLRRQRNTEAARRSRARKLRYVSVLEARVIALQEENYKLTQQLAAHQAAVAALKGSQQPPYP